MRIYYIKLAGKYFLAVFAEYIYFIKGENRRQQRRFSTLNIIHINVKTVMCIAI